MTDQDHIDAMLAKLRERIPGLEWCRLGNRLIGYWKVRGRVTDWQEAATAEAVRAWARTERRENFVIAGVLLPVIAALWFGVGWLENRSKLLQAEQRLEAEWRAQQSERERCMCPTVTP